MGITVGTGKGGPVAEPNIVPMIDVLLVLIIIFMVITPKTATGLHTRVPQPAPPGAPAQPGTVVVQVLTGEKLKINEEASDWDSLGPCLSNIFKSRAEKVAFVKGDQDVPFAEMARAIDIMRGVGIDHVGLVTPPAE